MQIACDVPLQHNSYQQAAKYEAIEFALDIKVDVNDITV